MFETRYVVKRIRRLAIAIGAGVSVTGISVFSIVAFLGRFVGTFTVSLDTANVGLALSETSTFEAPESFLHIDVLPAYSETTYKSLPGDTELDNEDNDYLYGANYTPSGEIQNISYFKYTFYVRNVGTTTARYDFKVNIMENEPSTDSHPRYLDDTLRVKLYDNDADGEEHEARVFAKPRSVPYVDKNSGEKVWETPISIREDQVSRNNPFEGYAESFESSTVVCTVSQLNFVKNATKRYTLVVWLEGNDESSNPALDAPEGAKLKLGVEINAYEN